MRIVVVLIAAWLTLTASLAEAQGVRLIGTASRARESVLTLLQQAGCQPLWLSEAMNDSRIKAGEWRHLKVGQRVILKTPDCVSAPPSCVAKSSQALMKQSIVVKKKAVPLVSKSKPEAPVLKPLLTQKPPPVLNVSAPPPVSPVPKPEWDRLAIGMGFGGLAVGILAAMLACLLWKKPSVNTRMTSSTSTKLDPP